MTTAPQEPFQISHHRWVSWLADGFGWRARSSRRHLDIRELSPHLQRDLGLLDGNDPHGRHQ